MESLSLDTTQIILVIDWILTVFAVTVLIVVWWQNSRQRATATAEMATSISAPPNIMGDIQADSLSSNDPLPDFPPHAKNTLRVDAILWGVIGYVVGASILSIVALQIWGPDSGDPASVLIGSGSQVFGAAMCIGLAHSRFQGGSRSFLLGTDKGNATVHLRVTLLAVVCAWGLCPAVLELTVLAIKFIAPSFELPDHPTIDALNSKDQSTVLVISLWIGAAVIAPVAEEIFFRGFIQTLFRNLLQNRSAAIFGASIIFAGIHFPQQPHAVPALIVLACILGYTYERTGSLVPAILVHGLFNLKTLVWLHFGSLPT